MRIVRLTVLLLFTSITFVFAQDPSSAKQVRTIFVAPLEGQNQGAANLLHAKLISSVSRLPGILVVEDEKDADAILAGSGLVETPSDEYGHASYHIQFGMRLSSRDKGIVLWADNIANSRFSRSASSSFADNVGKSLAQFLATKPKL